METGTKNELIVALCKAKLEFESITKDGKAKTEKFSYEYASLDMIIKATDKALANNGLNIRHYIESKEDNKLWLVTELRHISGCTPDRTETPVERFVDAGGRMSVIQSFGSALTYLRRYHMGLLLNLAIDEDDDGKETGKQQSKTDQPKGNQQEQVQTDIEKIKKHAFALSTWLGNTDTEMSEDCHLQFHVKSRAELSMEQWNEYIKTLEEYEKQLIDEAQLSVIISMLSKKVDKYPQQIDDPAFITYFNKILQIYYVGRKKAYVDIKTTKELKKWQTRIIIADMVTKMGKIE